MNKKIGTIGALSVTLGVLCLGCCAYAEETYTYTELESGTYAVTKDEEFSGYLLTGTDGALVIDMADAGISPEESGYTEGLEVYYADGDAASYDLGGRVIESRLLRGADVMLGIKFPVSQVDISDTCCYLDAENNRAYLDEYIGTDFYYVEGNDNSNSDFGRAYYNLLEYQEKVRKAASLQTEETAVSVYDNQGNLVTPEYINDMDALVEQVATFSDTTAIYKMDMGSDCANYIASNGTATLEFHNSNSGFLGYALIGTSIEDKTLVDPHYFTVDYNDGEFYIFRDTDVHTAYLYMDEEEAFMIDVGQFAGVELWNRVKNLIGDRPLTVFITHAHGDHWFNLQEFDYDQIKAVYIGENEVPTRVGENTGVYNLETEFEGNLKDKVVYWADGEVLTFAGKQFEFVQMSGHTPYGGGLIELEGRLFFSGDQLGTQTHGGGSSLKASTLESWVNGVEKLQERLAVDDPVDDIFMAHMPFGVPVSYVDDLSLILHGLEDDPESVIVHPSVGLKGSDLVIAKEGHILTQEECDELFMSNPTDGQVAGVYASVSYRDDMAEQ